MNKLPLIALLALAPLVPVFAQDKLKLNVSANVSTGDLLRTVMGGEARVVVILKNGSTTYNGWVKEVGTNAVVLKNAAGKEFYEVYVVLSEIAVVEVRVK